MDNSSALLMGAVLASLGAHTGLPMGTHEPIAIFRRGKFVKRSPERPLGARRRKAEDGYAWHPLKTHIIRTREKR